MADAIRFVLRRHGYRAGEYVVGYQSCDDSTAQSVGSDYFKCASNAKATRGDAARRADRPVHVVLRRGPAADPEPCVERERAGHQLLRTPTGA
jgi:hypothetical protein